MRVLPWILLVIGICVIIWLIFRPVPSSDNSVLQHRNDSLTQENLALRNALHITLTTDQPKIDSLNQVTKVLKKQDSIKSEKISFILKRESNTVSEYNRLKSEGKPTDSICDAAMKQKPIDSAIIADYQQNTHHIIFTMGQALSLKDSTILAQHRVIESDSVLIDNQKTLNTTQGQELKKIKASAKVNAWLARSLAVTAGVLFILFEIK